MQKMKKTEVKEVKIDASRMESIEEITKRITEGSDFMFVSVKEITEEEPDPTKEGETKEVEKINGAIIVNGDLKLMLESFFNKMKEDPKQKILLKILLLREMMLSREEEENPVEGLMRMLAMKKMIGGMHGLL